MSGCQLWLIAFAPDYKDKQTCCTGHQNSDERVAQPVGFHLPGRCHFFFFHDHSPGISGDGFAHLTDPFLILGSCPGFSSGSNEVTQSGIVANKLRTGRSITVHQFRMQGSDVFSCCSLAFHIPLRAVSIMTAVISCRAAGFCRLKYSLRFS